MARRQGRSFAVLLALLAVLAACAAPDGEGSPVTTDSPPTSVATTTSVPPSTTTTISLSTTTTAGPTTSSLSPPAEPAEIDAEVGVPEGEGPFPAVVLVHGGGWVGGNPGFMRPLADHLEDNGFLTVNIRYRLASLEVPGYPEAVEDVACAVRFAAAHPMSDGSVAIIGHSAGAHLAALVALKGDEYIGSCEIPGSGRPTRLVGLAGPYDTDRVGLAMLPFFGEGPSVNPELWEEGNPQAHADRNPGLSALIMFGEFDGLVDDRFASDFHQAIVEAGGDSLLELVEGARHNDMPDPTFVGDLIVTWLER